MPTIHVTDSEFIEAVFGEDAPFAHVTDFPYDPSNIPSDRHLSAWKGDWFSRYQFLPESNRYFTISIFSPDDQGVARRRKALYLRTRCVVLDDVREKLSIDEARKLPAPSWILETSPASEQWGYILDTPCLSAARIDNLNDGLIASDLAPSGKDPGQRGVTRYVRLPGGYNNKASKLVDGQPFKCRLLTWNPFNRVTMEQLAAPFAVNLDAPRREQRVDGAAAVSDHPLLDIPDIVYVKEVRSDGRFDITCPWVDEHTGADDSGSAVFTNGDGSIGFKCHHGACQTRTGRDLLQLIEGKSPGFGATFSNWKAVHAFQSIMARAAEVQPPAPVAEVSFLGTPSVPEPVPPAPAPTGGLDQLIGALRRERPTTPEARQMATEILRICEELPVIDQSYWHDQVRDLMAWSKVDLQRILKDLRTQWYLSGKKSHTFYDDVMFVKELNQFFDHQVCIFFSPESFQNSFMDQDSEARKSALQDGMVTKVDRLDFAPMKPRVFVERGVTYGNTWTPVADTSGEQGDVELWLTHFETLGWGGEQMEHILKFMAFTIKHPDVKINHVLLLGSGEGCGKDFLLYPLFAAMQEHSRTISGEELLEGFNDYVLSTKHLHINEAELGDRREAIAVGSKLKPLAAAPPDRLRVNQKGIKPVYVRNILNVTMTTNSQTPLRINGPSRRFFALWSDFTPRGADGEMLLEWKQFWERAWNWMRNGGAEACIWYLRNCVDLEGFLPGQAPPVTEFLQDIREASKTNITQTIEAFMRRRVGAFKADMVTVYDMISTLKAGEMVAPDLMFANVNAFTPARMMIEMREMHGVYKMRGVRGREQSTFWIIRNPEMYRHMTPSQLFNEHERQMNAPVISLAK